ncbi:hypothetical protein SLEP1_g53345 [Rubroshorea leprosula]|uniref:Glycosyltransferase n=1 Tax=Rubroshorea leprosula TaxID=152421 RepID=A0AAV5M944_9ROSI|nr:hypothetical protein SLEP1_g53345 [Rubroshorea leprosula]
MGSLSEQLHFVLFPFMSQGHLIPMTDIARLLAQQGVIITIVTTPVNAARVKPILSHAIQSGLPIHLAEIPFPCVETGIPEGCETTDKLFSIESYCNFFRAINMQPEPVEKLFEELRPRPCCIISDFCLYYTRKIATKFQIPRISFHGFCGFSLVCDLILRFSDVRENKASESEHFTVPGLPEKFEFTKAQMPIVTGEWKEFDELMSETDLAAYGEIVNTFEELESAYVEEYRKRRGGKVWCVGPVSLSHRDTLHKSQRGGKAAIDKEECLKWLDSQEKGSVVYVCLGSICNLISSQLIELGLGIEASNRPFIWVLRESDKLKDLHKWIEEEGFEERIKGRGLVIRGWAPQLLILSHPAVGGFLTHCGWNSALEGICSGLPLITWPLFGDQFCNEKLVVQIAKTGVRSGVEQPMVIGQEEEIGVLVKKEDVKNAIEQLMDGGKEAEERRKRARELAQMAKKAIEVGGSSHRHITQLIQDIMQQSLVKDLRST